MPVRDPSRAPIAETSRGASDARRKAPSLRYWLAAAGVAVAAIAVILYARPGPSRDVFSAPASFPRVDLPPERAQIALIQADTVKATLDSPTTNQVAANPEGKPAAGGSGTAEAATSPARVHVVVRGDTLWNIAKKHVGDASQYPELAKVSSIRNPHLIHPGDVVRIEVREPK
jgi:5'-nucleotidase